MIRTPPHHNTENPPGQIVNRPIQTIADYVERVKEVEKQPPKKLTFDEWFQNNIGPITERKEGSYNLLKKCWNAAQENK